MSEVAAPPNALNPSMPREAWHRMIRDGQLLKLSAFLIAVAMAVTGHATPLDWALLAVGCVLTLFGITAGMHRLFAHRSYEAKPWLRYALAVLGTSAGQGSVLMWASVHRCHHQFTEQEQDPHSPTRGFWHAQVGWILGWWPEDYAHYVPDLVAEPVLVKLHQHQVLVTHLGVAVAALVSFAFTHTWQGFLAGIVWGGWARIFVAEQLTCLVNSACHLWGTRPFETRDHSVNNWLIAPIVLGEGWHNNHHAFPSSARQGLAWWEIDPTYMVIRVWQALGLVSRVVVPEKGAIEAKRRVAASTQK